MGLWVLPLFGSLECFIADFLGHHFEIHITLKEIWNFYIYQKGGGGFKKGQETWYGVKKGTGYESHDLNGGLCSTADFGAFAAFKPVSSEIRGSSGMVPHRIVVVNNKMRYRTEK